MKKILFLIFISTLVFGCQRNNPNPQLGKLISHTDCKYSKDAFFNNTESCIEYIYNSTEKTIRLKHINAAFNCCPDQLFFTVQFLADTIIIEEAEKKQDCNCLCLYDVHIELYDIDERTYVLKFEEPYVYNDESLTFQVDLQLNSSGIFCVQRSIYPWGMKDF